MRLPFTFQRILNGIVLPGVHNGGILDIGYHGILVKVDVDANPAAAATYGVRGIPTLMVFKGGQVAATKVGAAPKNQLQSWIEQSI